MSAKQLRLEAITAARGNAFIKKHHYSGRVVANSKLHIGVFWNERLEGVMQLGPPLDKSKLLPLVEGTPWDGMLELNRMAFTQTLPRNSESRALGVLVRLLRTRYPQIKWIVSYADATKCGDGTIYRAAGFILTAIKRNTQLYALPHPDRIDHAAMLARGFSERDIRVVTAWVRERMTLEGAPAAHRMTLEGGVRASRLLSQVKHMMRVRTGGATSSHQFYLDIGGCQLEGHQLRYVRFVDPSWRERLAVPALPYGQIDAKGAGMYLGRPK